MVINKYLLDELLGNGKLSLWLWGDRSCPVVCCNWPAWAHENQLSESLPNTVQWSYIGSLKSLTVGIFTLWELANTVK